MIKIEPRVAELRNVSKEKKGLLAKLDKFQDLIDNKNRHADGIKIEFEDAKQDMLNQNPYADDTALNKDIKIALGDLEDDYQTVLKSVDGIKQTIRVKRTTERVIEDRMNM
jgi:hypothetical protein